MNNALRVAYPGSQSVTGMVFGPVINPQTYLRAIHLLSMFPLGIAYFVSLVTLLALGGSLIWTFPGMLIVLATIFASRLIGDFESAVTGTVSGIEIRRPPWRTEGIVGWRSRVWTRLIDPTTWTGIVYLFVQFPVGIGAFVFLVVTSSVSGALVASPLIIHFSGDPLELDFAGWLLILDRPVEALWLIPIGLLLFLLTIHLVTAFSAMHATWANFMLGSRAKPIVEKSSPPDPLLPDRKSPEESSEIRPPPDDSGSVREFSPTPATDDLPWPRNPIPEVGHEIKTAADRSEVPMANDLTNREREVLLLLARGMTNAEIAEVCVISQGTVKTHVKRILSKLQLHDRTQVVVFAYESGLVAPESGIRARSAIT